MHPSSPPPLSRRRWLLAATGAASATLAPSARGAPVTTIRLSHVVARETPKGIALERFGELVQERSRGRLRVDIYPRSELYGDHDEMQALQLGAIDMVAPSLSKFGPIGFPEFEVFDLPFLFDSLEGVRRLSRGTVGQKLLQSLRRQRLLGLGFFDNGLKHMSANRRLLEPRDFRGLRMRVQASWVLAQQMRAWGATPVMLPFGETRRALETGVVDGTENPVSNFWTQGMYAVQSDLSLTAHGYLGYAVVTHQRFWENLPSADRRLVQGALDEALNLGNTIADAQNDKALAELQRAAAVQIHRPTAAQTRQLQQASLQVHAELAARIGQDWLTTVRKALQKST